MSIYISPGNTKTGAIPSFSLPVGLSCWPGVPCFEDGCYDVRNVNFRQAVWQSRVRNWKAVHEDMDRVFKQIQGFLDYQEPRFFRHGIGGDLWLGDLARTQRYFNNWRMLAVNNPTTRFLIFTKCYKLEYDYAPKNLSVVWSAWPGYPLPEVMQDGIAGIAYMQDGTETRVPDDAFECAGNCISCNACWNIKKTPSRAVVFHKH